MKLWALSLVAILIGAVAGAGVTYSEFSRGTERFVVSRDEDEHEGHGDAHAHDGHDHAAHGTPASRTELVGGPHVEVEGGTEHNFGSMELGSTGKHEFVIRNTGTRPLELEKGETTCKCTISELGQSSLPPGGSAKITLEWKPNEAGSFRQTAEIHTNDPENRLLRLVIRGRVESTVHAMPPDLHFDRISTNKTSRGAVNIITNREQPLSIEKWEFSNKELAEFFEVTMEPMTAEQLTIMPNANNGIRIRVDIKPGLPLGDFQQKIYVLTNFEDAPGLEIPVEGSVVSDISVLGGGNFNERSSVLTLGTLSSGEGANATLHLLVKGPHREETDMEILSVDPQGILKAELGEAKDNSAVKIVPLRVEVLEGARTISRLGADGFGEIIIKTTHPQVKEMKIYVKFAVEA